MKRILIECAYDGTEYHGWESQEGQRTIQGEIENALYRLTGEITRISGISRTDAGVHALKNIAVFDTDMRIESGKYANALNAYLPEDIAVRRSYEVEAGFNLRRQQTLKTYEYSIINDRYPVPTKRLYSHFVYVPLDAEKMDKAAECLLGEHDFRSFCSVHTQTETTVRTITDISVIRKDNEIKITVQGRGFLYNMVRIIAGTLIDVGRGAVEPERTEKILAACDRSEAGPTAPACGLTLMNIDFISENSAGALDTHGPVV